MQNYEFSPEKIKKFTQKISLLNLFRHQVRIDNFAQELAERSFAERYALLYFLAIFIAFAAQILSLYSSYASVEKIVSVKFQHPETIQGLTIFILLSIEMFKYALKHTTLRDIFNIKPSFPYLLILLTLGVLILSAYLSVSGSTELAKDRRQEQILTTEQAGKEKALKAEIEKIRDTDTYKSIIWNGNGSTSKILTEAGKALVAKREAELDSLRKTYQTKTQDFQKVQAQNQQRYNYFFGIFEALFLFATVAIFYYKRTCLIERELTTQTQVQTNANQYEPIENHANTQTNLNSNQYEPTSQIAVNSIENASNAVQTTTNQYESTHTKAPTKLRKLLRFKKRLRTHSEPAPNSSEVPQTESEPTPNPTTNQEEIETAYQKILAQSNGKAKYLEKYKEATKQLLTLKYAEMPMQDICQTVTQDHDIGRTTFYNVLRIINNTDK